MSPPKKPTQSTAPCIEQSAPAWPGPEPSPEELALVSKSFARCLLEKGYGPKDLIEAANLLLDQAIEQARAEREPAPSPPAATGKKRSKSSSGAGRSGAGKKLAAASR